MTWIETFKCRCSGISKIMSVKKGCEPISEVQLRRIAELEARTKAMTPNMEIEYAALINKRDNPPPKQLSDGCIEYLMEVYSWNEHGTIAVGKESKEIMQLEKGKKVERTSIELLSVVEDVYYEQHKDRIFNDYLSGQIDCYLGNSVYEATNITDIKSSFDQPSSNIAPKVFKTIFKTMNQDNNTIAEVNCCKECPFIFYEETGSEFCNHPHHPKNDYIEDRLIIPTWCPLKTQPITIKLKD